MINTWSRCDPVFFSVDRFSITELFCQQAAVGALKITCRWHFNEIGFPPEPSATISVTAIVSDAITMHEMERAKVSAIHGAANLTGHRLRLDRSYVINLGGSLATVSLKGINQIVFCFQFKHLIRVRLWDNNTCIRCPNRYCDLGNHEHWVNDKRMFVIVRSLERSQCRLSNLSPGFEFGIVYTARNEVCPYLAFTQPEANGALKLKKQFERSIGLVPESSGWYIAGSRLMRCGS